MKKTLEEILVTYQKKKEKKEKENELIKKELYRKYPEFDEIERKIAKLYLQKSIKNLTIKKQNIDKGEFIKIDEISNIDREIKKLEEKKEKYIKDKKIKIIGMHIGGEARRGELSDKFVKVAAPYCDYLIIVDEGNKDGMFTKISSEKKIPMDTVPKITNAVDPLKKAFE